MSKHRSSFASTLKPYIWALYQMDIEISPKVFGMFDLGDQSFTNQDLYLQMLFFLSLLALWKVRMD